MKIPLLQRAQALSARPLSLFASAWTSPAWLKTNGALIGKGSLKGMPGGKEYKTWAQYYIRFLEDYGKHNISFWGLTTGNEPTAGELTNYSFQALGFTPELQRDWIALDLGPTLHSSPYAKTRLMILDDQRLLLPHWAKVVLSDVHAARYVHGIGVHWYMDFFTPAKITLTTTHDLYPEYFILGTEACSGFSSLDRGVRLGSWERAEDYAHNIIEDLNNYVTGWTDWNLALDMSGGPNWVKNFVDSPIIVDQSKDIFYKQPTFYSMAHFSKFLWEGSQRIGVSVSEHTSLESSAFVRPDGSVVMIILNSYFSEENYAEESEMQLPTVVMDLIARNAAHSLPYYLGALERLHYPKERISIWAATDHNIDNTTAMLREWLTVMQQHYHYIEWRPVDKPTSYNGEMGPKHWFIVTTVLEC